MRSDSEICNPEALPTADRSALEVPQPARALVLTMSSRSSSSLPTLKGSEASSTLPSPRPVEENLLNSRT